MSEYIEFADILFLIKDKLDDNEYLKISNLLMKAKNKYDVIENNILEKLVALTQKKIKDLNKDTQKDIQYIYRYTLTIN